MTKKKKKESVIYIYFFLFYFIMSLHRFCIINVFKRLHHKPSEVICVLIKYLFAISHRNTCVCGIISNCFYIREEDSIMKWKFDLHSSCPKLAIEKLTLPLENFTYTLWSGRWYTVSILILSLISTEAGETNFSRELSFTKSILTLNFVKGM